MFRQPQIKQPENFYVFQFAATRESEGAYSHQNGIDKHTKAFISERDAVMKTLIIPTQVKLDSIDHVIDTQLAQEIKFQQTNTGLMAMIIAFIKMSFRTSEGTGIFIVLFIVAFLMELIVLILKICMRKSQFEIDEEELSNTFSRGYSLRS